MIFSYRDKVIIPDITLGPDVLEQTSKIKFLCLYVECNLKFVSHVDHIAKKISKSLGILNKIKYFLPTKDNVRFITIL